MSDELNNQSVVSYSIQTTKDVDESGEVKTKVVSYNLHVKIEHTMSDDKKLEVISQAREVLDNFESKVLLKDTTTW